LRNDVGSDEKRNKRTRSSKNANAPTSGQGAGAGSFEIDFVNKLKSD